MTPPPVQIERYQTLPMLIDAAARRFLTTVSAIQSDPRGGVSGDGIPRIVLTGGTAGIGLLDRLSARQTGHSQQNSIDWSRMHVFFGDERNVPRHHPDSNEGQAADALLDSVGIPPDRVHGYGLDGSSMEGAVNAYTRLLDRVAPDGFDLHLLGMGGEGHINSLFPYSVGLRDDAPAVLAVHDSPKPPPERVTLTLPAIRNSQRVWFLVSGSEKATAASRLVQGTQSTSWPAAGARGKKETLLFVTSDAAALLDPPE